MQEQSETVADDTPPAKEYPTNFKDLEGREWSVVIRPSDVKKLDKALGVDIWKTADLQSGPLVKLTEERCLLSTLWLLCEAQAETRGINEDAFCDGFNGKVFDDAFEAIQGAILVFFSGARAAQLRKILAHLESMRAVDLAELDARHAIQREEMDKLKPAAAKQYREAIQREAPKMIARELSRAISSRLTEKPPAPSA